MYKMIALAVVASSAFFAGTMTAQASAFRDPTLTPRRAAHTSHAHSAQTRRTAPAIRSTATSSATIARVSMPIALPLNLQR